MRHEISCAQALPAAASNEVSIAVRLVRHQAVPSSCPWSTRFSACNAICQESSCSSALSSSGPANAHDDQHPRSVCRRDTVRLDPVGGVIRDRQPIRDVRFAPKSGHISRHNGPSASPASPPIASSEELRTLRHSETSTNRTTGRGGRVQKAQGADYACFLARLSHHPTHQRQNSDYRPAA